jgi:two-component system OmpR family response regulator
MTHRILVVDDEPALTRMLQKNLERTGKFQVRTENKGAAAVAAAREFQPHLIFLDVMMPDMQGDEIAAALDEDPALRGTPYIFLTAIVTHDETDSTQGEIGGKLFLAKPVKLQEMLDMIERVLNSSA